MVYLYYISCLRYTILVGNLRYGSVVCLLVVVVVVIFFFRLFGWFGLFCLVVFRRGRGGMPATLIVTIESFHFIPLLVTLTLAGGHKVSNKQNISSSSCTLSN